jgi:hypothetical protein
MLALPAMGTDMLRALRATLERSHDLAMAEAVQVLTGFGAMAVLPVAAAAALGAIAATLAADRRPGLGQGAAPRLDKLSPLAGAKRMVSPEAAVEFLRTLLKLALVGAALWYALGDLTMIQAALHQPPGSLPASAGAASLRLMLAALVAFAGIAGLEHALGPPAPPRPLRMSKQELREEAKDSEGDPRAQGPSPPAAPGAEPPAHDGGGAEGRGGGDQPDPLRRGAGLWRRQRGPDAGGQGRRRDGRPYPRGGGGPPACRSSPTRPWRAPCGGWRWIRKFPPNITRP